MSRSKERPRSGGECEIVPRGAFGAAGGARLLHRLSGLLLPQDCLLCGAPAGPEADGPVCPACAVSLPRLPAAHCPVCALPTPAGEVCGACLARPPMFDATLALHLYAFPVDRLIQSLKYRHRLALSGWFGRGMAALVQAMSGEGGGGMPSLILPMPLHPRRLAERGFNQALELARPVARLTGLPLLPDAAERASNAVPQASLPWKERRRNIRGAFLCRMDLAGRHVLVLDDVMTTGATLDELAACLKRRAAARVTNLVLARTLPHGAF